MCDKCFNQEIKRFENYSAHELFSESLCGHKYLSTIERIDSDLGEPRFWLFGIIGIGTKRKSKIGYDILVCSECGQKWKYSIPDNAWRGFFIKQESTEYLDSFGKTHALN